jgi:UTP--glucose-1-phosphate uridylyltransferase
VDEPECGSHSPAKKNYDLGCGSGGEIQITDAMRALLKKHPFYALRFEGTRHDAGDRLGFLVATVEFAFKRPELAPQF